jgi:hypothetical protein
MELQTRLTTSIAVATLAAAAALTGLAYGANSVGDDISSEKPLITALQDAQAKDEGYRAWKDIVEEIGIEHASMTTDGIQYIDNILGLYLSKETTARQAVTEATKLSGVPAKIVQSPNKYLSEHADFYVIKFSKGLDYEQLTSIAKSLEKDEFADMAVLSPVFEGAFWNIDDGRDEGDSSGKKASESAVKSGNADIERSQDGQGKASNGNGENALQGNLNTGTADKDEGAGSGESIEL